MTGHISVRESIRWLPDEASEPTSTIVLTSPGRLFVDLRIYKSESGIIESDAVLPLSRLEWAIAGTSVDSSETGGIDPVDQHWRGKWIHWIDSRTEDCTDVADEGDMFPLPPDGARVLEKGRMVNSATGLETDYEEIWGSEEISKEVEPKSCCLVLQLDQTGESGKKRQGRIVRLGQYVQGFVRAGEELVVERWKWEGEWERVVKIGEGIEIPTDFVTGFGHEAQVDDEVRVGQDIWKVVEKS
ncbi:protein HRI1 [Rhypophila decipiens]|uniref:Protein HRI1 n=1 Tax=Rhypophila decipiens TaxID=261697 RepID=A0AAN7B949_9PEZI|nr:protein HRI1 [Rhypophila decipiens]